MNPVEPYQDGLFDGTWAADWAHSDGVERTGSYDHIVRERFLPAIGDPEVEARKASEAYWNDKMSEPVGDDGDVDPGSIADDANERLSRRTNCCSLYESQLSILERLAWIMCLCGRCGFVWKVTSAGLP